MKARQIERLLMHLSLGKVFREHIAIVGMVPGMMKNVKEYDKLLQQILETMKKQQAPIKQLGELKKQARIRMVERAYHLQNRGCAYANSLNNATLREKFGHSYSFLYKQADSTTGSLCNIINKLLIEHHEPLKAWGIKQKDTEELKRLIKQFRELELKPILKRNERATATKMLAMELEGAGKSLKSGIDKMLSCYEAFPEFMKAYKTARVQVKYKNPKIPLARKIKAFYEAPVVPVQRRRKKVERELVLVEG